VEGGIALGGLPEDPAEYGDAMLVLADPNTFSADALLAHLNDARPMMPVLGGLASAAAGGSASLFCDGGVVDSGAVACSLSGVELLPCVSQGAAPVGPEMTVTGVEGNLITELASQPALERLREALEDLEPDERDLAAQGLLLGVVIDENQPEYERGDFLVRPIVGVDPESGALAFADRVRTGQTVRLHVRDSESATDDLREALAAQVAALGPEGAAGALLFTCNGRGAHMFARPDHDAELLDQTLGAPAGGFFCAGEIGPVGGRNFLHGFTATMAVFPRA
jgi:small ligand-binding sensory domain FIST